MTDDTRDRGLHRHGDPDPSKWDEAEAVTGRANDTPPHTPPEAVPNSTLATRAKARQSDEKQVDPGDVEDKSVTAAKTKAPAKKAARRG